MKIRIPRELLGLVAVVVFAVFGWELLVLLVEELVDLVVDVTHTGFMLLYEEAFGLSYEKAQGRAAWSTAVLILSLVLFTAWRLAPWVKRTSRDYHARFVAFRGALSEVWREAAWYQKLLFGLGSLLVIGALVVVI